jgi:hypothetical protein
MVAVALAYNSVSASGGHRRLVGCSGGAKDKEEFGDRTPGTCRRGKQDIRFVELFSMPARSSGKLSASDASDSGVEYFG